MLIERISHWLDLARASKGTISVKGDRNNVILSEAIPPVVRKCHRKKFDLVNPEKGRDSGGS